MSPTEAAGFAATTVGQLRHETNVRTRTRVGFAHPRPTRKNERYPFIESAICQWPGDHPSHPYQLYVPLDERLIQAYQEGHAEILVLTQMTSLIARSRLNLPFLAENVRRRSLSHQIHFDNTGWSFEGVADNSPLWLYDPTVDGGYASIACVRWEQQVYLKTKLLIVDLPPGVPKRSLALVDRQMATIRQRFVNEWLGGPEVARKLLGL